MLAYEKLLILMGKANYFLFAWFYKNYRSLITISAELATIVGFIWALFSLSGFKKAKRIENNALEARRAIDELDQIHESLLELLYGPEEVKRDIALKQKLPHQINNLQNTLYFLNDFEYISPEIELTTTLKEVVKKYQKNHEYNKVSDEIKNTLNWDNGTGSRLLLLRGKLFKIYKMKK